MWLCRKSIAWAILMVISLSALVVQPFAYAAEEIDIRTKALNQIYFYSECGDSGGRFLTGGGSGKAFGKTVQEKLANYYSSMLTPIAIAGIMGNVSGESGWNPFRFEGNSASGAGYGIYQFTDPAATRGSAGNRTGVDNKLRSDPRTADLFNEYHDIKYGAEAWDDDHAVPKSVDIPDDVINAWLEVQLDFMYETEMTTTKVGTYRGGMSWDGVTDDMNIMDAMNAAKSPSDAAWIWYKIYERPGGADATGSGRASNAEAKLDLVNEILGSSGSNSGSRTGSSTSANDINAMNVKDEGKNVTIIGDSITVRTQSTGSFDKKLKNADIYKPKVGKHMFSDDSSGGTSGENLIKELISSKELRDVVVIALGTNDAGGLTRSDVQGLVDMINEDGDHTIVFVTNYSVSKIDFTSNNNVLNEIKNANSNVVVADWAGAVSADPGKYMDDDVHPVEGVGTDLFAETIYGALTGGVTESRERRYDEACPGSKSSGSSDTNSDGVTFADYNGKKIAFPIAGATKDNISGGRGQYTFLSNIPCSNGTGCHYGAGTDPAFDICFADGNRCNNDTPVVSMTDGTVTRDIQTIRNGAQCNHVRIKSDIDNTVIAYMHLRYEADLPWHAGDKVKAGDLIGHVSDVGACHDNSTPHVHVDKGKDPSATGGPSGTSDRDPELVSMMNAAYKKLPEDEAELQARRSGNVGEGGLTYDQAKEFMKNYGANKGGSSADAMGGLWSSCNGGGSNCVAFSAFFYNKFTSNHRETFGNGYEVVDSLKKDKGVKAVSQPKVWSVFSWSGGSQGFGHTGVILGYQNGEWIVGHASCSNSGIGEGDGTQEGGGAGFVKKSSDINDAVWGVGRSNLKFADLSGIVDTNKIQQYLKDGK